MATQAVLVATVAMPDSFQVVGLMREAAQAGSQLGPMPPWAVKMPLASGLVAIHIVVVAAAVVAATAATAAAAVAATTMVVAVAVAATQAAAAVPTLPMAAAAAPTALAHPKSIPQDSKQAMAKWYCHGRALAAPPLPARQSL